MVCRAGSKYFGSDTTTASWKNWSGRRNLQPSDAARAEASSAAWRGWRGSPTGSYITDPSDGLASLVEVVADATDKKQELHVVGNFGRSRTAPSRTAQWCRSRT